MSLFFPVTWTALLPASFNYCPTNDVLHSKKQSQGPQSNYSGYRPYGYDWSLGFVWFTLWVDDLTVHSHMSNNHMSVTLKHSHSCIVWMRSSQHYFSLPQTRTSPNPIYKIELNNLTGLKQKVCGTPKNDAIDFTLAKSNSPHSSICGDKDATSGSW